MLKYIFGIKKARQYRHMPKSYKLVFADGVFESIKKLKGWKSNADVGRETGYTRQYVSMVSRGVTSVTTDFLMRILELTGNLDNLNWSQMFKIVPRGEYRPNHQLWNNEKSQGRIPYAKDSLSADFRRKDNEVELVKN